MELIHLIVHRHIRDYKKAVQSFLERNEVENGLFLGILDFLEKDSPSTTEAFMAQVKAGQETIAASVYRDRNLIVTRGPKEVWLALATKLRETEIDIPGVVGPAAEAEQMASAWVQVRGCAAHLAMDQRLYQLNQVGWPQGIPGRVRLVGDTDLEFLSHSIQGFYRDAIPWEIITEEELHQNAARRVREGMTYLWDLNGKPVALAALTRPTQRGIAVNAVYTPPEHRKHGYATALVAAVSAEGLRRSKEFCVLYTDLMNPTSNSIYQKVGYRPVCDSRNYRF